MSTKRPTHPNASLNALSEQIGNFIEYWGFKKIHGMIWTHLYLSPTPISAQDLITRLKVSKALISLSVKDLLHYDLILQTPESKTKKNKFYTANPEVFQVIRNVLETREKQMLTRIHEDYVTLYELQDHAASKALIDPMKIALLGLMIEGSQQALDHLIDAEPINIGDLMKALNSHSKDSEH